MAMRTRFERLRGASAFRTRKLPQVQRPREFQVMAGPCGECGDAKGRLVKLQGGVTMFWTCCGAFYRDV